jgi:hypothetical protein
LQNQAGARIGAFQPDPGVLALAQTLSKICQVPGLWKTPQTKETKAKINFQNLPINYSNLPYLKYSHE